MTDVGFVFQLGAICKKKLGANFTLAISKAYRPSNTASKAAASYLHSVTLSNIFLLTLLEMV